jgi:CAAX protease family protein
VRFDHVLVRAGDRIRIEPARGARDLRFEHAKTMHAECGAPHRGMTGGFTPWTICPPVMVISTRASQSLRARSRRDHAAARPRPYVFSILSRHAVMIGMVLKRHGVIFFILAAYFWTWAVNLPQLPFLGAHRISQGATTLASFSPSIVAMLLLAVGGGWGEVRALLRRLRPTGRDVVLAGGAVAIAVGSVGLSFLAYEQIAHQHVLLASPSNLVGTMLILIPLTGFFEELGWRGYMLDRLQERMSVVRATFCVAITWAVWHVPMLLRLRSEGSNTPALIAAFLLGTIPLSFIFTALYNGARRQLLPVIVFHAAIDASIGYFLGPMPRGDIRAFIFWIGMITVVAISLAAARHRFEWTTPSGPARS